MSLDSLVGCRDVLPPTEIHLMASKTPLQILLFRHPQDRDLAAFEDAIVRAVRGGRDTSGYLTTGDDLGEGLGIQLRTFDAEVPNRPAAAVLDECCHTCVIVLVDDTLLNSPALLDWLDQCWAHVRASDGRHAALAVPATERQAGDFAGKRPSLGALQIRSADTYGERAVRPAMVALFMLHTCRTLLSRSLTRAEGAPCESLDFLRLFISHAKVDGLPLAQALRHLIASVDWLSSFYDAKDLPAGCDWQLELERGVGSSLIIILRTDGYDGRPWCQQEVRWSDSYATPAVLVEARTGLNYPAAALPFDRAPMVRIPDGNLIRILFAALREGLRFLYFKRRVQELKETGALPDRVDLHVFSSPPSMPALLRVCRVARKRQAPRYIVYPDPPLGTGAYEAAHALVAEFAPPGTRLVTPNTLAATSP
jgi:hypothetical protein